MVKYKKFLGKIKYLLLPKYILLSRTLFTTNMRQNLFHIFIVLKTASNTNENLLFFKLLNAEKKSNQCHSFEQKSNLNITFYV